jgi:hypothetical protein
MSKIRIALAVFAAAAWLAMPASAARMWGRPMPPPAPGDSPLDQASDYAHIVDIRGPLDQVSVQWLEPMTMKVEPDQKAALDQYIVVAVAHVSCATNCRTIQTHEDEIPAAFDADGRSLAPVLEPEQPDALRAVLGLERRVVREVNMPDDVGPPPGDLRDLVVAYFHNQRFYAFRAGAVHECTKGRLAIAFAGKQYTFDTPIPGCPATDQPPAKP